jgi:hypothetical protein
VVIERPMLHRQFPLALIFCVTNRLLFHLRCSSYGILISLT